MIGGSGSPRNTSIFHEARRVGSLDEAERDRLGAERKESLKCTLSLSNSYFHSRFLMLCDVDRVVWPGRAVIQERLVCRRNKMGCVAQGQTERELQTQGAVRLLSIFLLAYFVFCLLKTSPQDADELGQTWQWLKGLLWAVLAPTGDGP